jgi:hypothetical protein
MENYLCRETVEMRLFILKKLPAFSPEIAAEFDFVFRTW